VETGLASSSLPEEICGPDKIGDQQGTVVVEF